jgi:NitT/TauT family transport system substrate-binding protein
MNNLRNITATALLMCVVMFCSTATANDLFKVRVGVLKFGTVNWALSVIKEQGLDQAEGVELEVVPLANKNATNVALQGGAVDMIVTDWIWVSRQRAEGKTYTFAPYSLAVGSLMVHPDAGISSIADLEGKNLGIAGGPVDKSWLLIRAYSQQELGKDIADMLQPNFAAPPLLNELMAQGELDAALNFWHFTARLKAQGMQELIGVGDILPALGVEGEAPLLGWVFDESWANDNRDGVESFLRAARNATSMMKTDDALWDGFLRPLTKAKDDATLLALRDGFRAGVPTQFGDNEIKVAGQVFEILAKLGGEDLIGASTTLQPGTFWQGYGF